MNKSKIGGLIARILLGILFLFSGLNGVLYEFFGVSIIEPEASANPQIIQYFEVVSATYMLQTVKIFETIAGALLLTGVAVPLAIVMLAPIIINIFLFHLVFEPNELLMTIGILLLYMVLIYSYFRNLTSLLSERR